MNILVVDDHQIFRSGVVAHLNAADPDIQVTEAHHVDAALSLLGAGQPCDLMLLDLHMPGYKDVEALAKVRQLREDLPVLVLSGQENPDLVYRCVELGAFGFLPKSAPAATLHPALKLVLSGGVFLPPSSLSVVSHPGQAHGPDGQWARLGVQLTQRQRDVLLRIAQGKPNKVVARELGLSDSTVKTHVNNIFNALAVSNRTQAVYALARAGISIHELGAADPVRD